MSKKRVVYSTDQGNLCADCRQPTSQCRCVDTPPGVDGPSSVNAIVRIHRQSKGRNGKPVSIITGVPLAGSELKQLAKELKAKCGVGGSIENHDILIQGDQRDKLKSLLEAKGYQVKLAGG